MATLDMRKPDQAMPAAYRNRGVYDQYANAGAVMRPDEIEQAAFEIGVIEHAGIEVAREQVQRGACLFS